jgi:hypothetical protein
MSGDGQLQFTSIVFSASDVCGRRRRRRDKEVVNRSGPRHVAAAAWQLVGVGLEVVPTLESRRASQREIAPPTTPLTGGPFNIRVLIPRR